MHNKDPLSIEATAHLEVQKKKLKAAKDKVNRLFSEHNKMAVMLANLNEGIKKRDAAIKKEKEELSGRKEERLKSRL